MYKAKSFATLTAAVGIVVLLPALASAAWTKPGTGSGASIAGSLTEPTGVTVSSPSSGTVTVSWTAGAAPAGAPVTYLVERKSGTTYTPAGGTCASPATSPCNDTGVANGTYQYRVTTKVGTNWVKVSTDSGNVTVGTTALTVTSPSTASPVSISRAAATKSFVVTGTGFVSLPTVTITGNQVNSVTTTFQSSTQITVTFTFGNNSNANTGLRSFTVTNPGGAATTCTNCLNITT